MLALGCSQGSDPVHSFHTQKLLSLCCDGWDYFFIVLFVQFTVTLSFSLMSSLRLPILSYLRPKETSALLRSLEI